MPSRHPFACLLASVLTVIAGIILLIVASIATSDVGPVRGGWPLLFGLSVYSIVIGSLAIVIPIGLIYVAYRQFPALTLLFSVLVMTVALLALICGIILITGRANFESKTYASMERLFRNYSDSDAVLSSKSSVAQIQQRFECCGYDQATDWKVILDGASTPDSCCINIYDQCGKNALIRLDIIYLRGCAVPSTIHYKLRYNALIGTNFTVFALALISAIFGFLYERIIRKQYELM
jgi:hypothetical protein